MIGGRAILRWAGGAATLAALATCVPAGPEARRAAYLDCARDQGVTVRDGTIVSRSAADLRRLDACEALPR
ncbi:hypothetical protein MWU52_11320 [Jannaschia sp. S6380]|uniref:hypothetical protein n=1 Tax=Jannaschia sp. S6380 TaxID=2926408 RepID=UPI001FF13910|nr:hypothetical protein [Jannaschia sp. S6380]MCK0168144.1 hypothetical protein [Jannaschia sp. S6380]